MSIFLFIVFLVLLFLSVPVAVSLGLATIITLYFYPSIPLLVVPQKLFTATDSFPLMAIPFFMIAGAVMERGGISRRLIDFANDLIGHLSGGLALVTVMASMFFAAISGSSPATVAAIGAIMIPAMVKQKYPIEFASATQASAGYIGVIIPPSIPMITFGVVTGASIGGLFMAGLIPGLLIGLSLMAVAYLTSKKHGYIGDEKVSWSVRLTSFKNAIFALLMPIIILGGIYGGVFTPTEAANVAVIYGLIVGFFVYKELKICDLVPILRSAAISTSMVMLIIATASAFGLILTREMFPNTVANFLIDISSNKYVLLILLTLMLLIVGTFMETNAAIIILAPIFFPIIVQMGIDPIHFGVIMVVNLAIGMITPPLGINLFVACGLTKLPIERIVSANWVYLFVSLLALALITFVPIISLLLPSIFM